MNDSNKKKKPRRYRHLSDEERYDIIGYMDQGMSFRAIGRRIGRSASKVEREAHCERNHEKFRYVVPKGISLDGFSQEDVDEMFSDVDSYATKATEWKRPCELLAGSYSPELLSFTGVRPMSVTDVNLRPRF